MLLGDKIKSTIALGETQGPDKRWGHYNIDLEKARWATHLCTSKRPASKAKKGRKFRLSVWVNKQATRGDDGQLTRKRPTIRVEVEDVGRSAGGRVFVTRMCLQY